MRLPILATLLTFMGFVAAAQGPTVTPPAAAGTPPTGVIVGQIVDGSSGRPVSGALVGLSPAPPGLSGLTAGQPAPLDQILSISLTGMLSAARQAIADGQGRFAFTNLPAATFSLTATKPGWSGGAFGQERADGSPAPVVLGVDSRLGNVVLKLWRNAAIAGTVVDEAGEPIVGLQVRALRRTWLAGRARFTLAGAAQTDDRGMYRISGLRPAEYSAVIAQTSATAPVGGAPQPLDPAMFQSLIAANGPGADPSTLLSNISALTSGGPSSNGIRVGEWVLQTTAPGSRLIPPARANGRWLAYRTTFYPNVPSSSHAQTVVLGSGDERTGLDFQLRPVPVSQLSGVLTAAEGPASNIDVRLVPGGDDELSSDAGFEIATTKTSATGAFTFLAVPAGQYILKVVRTPRPIMPLPVPGPAPNMSMIQTAQGNRALSMGTMTMDMMMPSPPAIPEEPTLWASVPVSIGETDEAGLTLALRPGYRVSGRAEFEGTSVKPTPDQLRRMPVVLDRADVGGVAPSPVAGVGSASTGQFDVEGRFTTYGLVPGRYYVRAPFSYAGWSLKSASLAGQDLADVPLDIDNADVSGVILTFTDRVSELAGTLRDSQGRAKTASSVLVFPTQPEAWVDFGSSPRRIRVAKAGADGRYRVAGLPAGAYFAATVEGEAAADWQNPVFLETLSRTAIRFAMTDAEKKSLDLVVR